MLTRYETKKIIKLVSYVLVVLILAGYTLFATHDLLLGPEVVIIQPNNINSFATSSITIVGKAKRSQNITLNDKSITIDEMGNFRETTLLAKGYNVFKITATDRLKRKVEYRLEYINTLK